MNARYALLDAYDHMADAQRQILYLRQRVTEAQASLKEHYQRWGQEHAASDVASDANSRAQVWPTDPPIAKADFSLGECFWCSEQGARRLMLERLLHAEHSLIRELAEIVRMRASMKGARAGLAP